MLGGVYAAVLRFAPLTLFNFVLTPLFTLACGVAVQPLLRLGRSRSVWLDLIIGCAMGSVAIWLSWAWWLMMYTGMNFATFVEVVKAGPVDLASSWVELSMEYQITTEGKRWRRDWTASPALMVLIWEIEAASSSSAPASSPRSRAATRSVRRRADGLRLSHPATCRAGSATSRPPATP